MRPALHRIWYALDKHLAELIAGASTALVIRLAGAVLSFALNVVLARFLGAEGTGLYLLALTCVTIGAVVGRVGLDKTIVRFVAGNIAVGDWGAVRGAYRMSTAIVFAGAAVVSALLAASAPWLAETIFVKPQLGPHLQVMALAVIPVALFILHANALIGLKKIRDSVLVLSVLLPVFTLAGVLVLVPAYGLDGAVIGYTAGAFVTLAIGRLRWRRWLAAKRAPATYLESPEMWRSTLPLFWVALMQQVLSWAPTLILGMWVASSEVGIFGMANRTAILVSFVLTAVNNISAPKFAALYKTGEMATLARTVNHAAIMMTVAAMPLVALFMVFPEEVLGIFGASFRPGGHVLMVLAAGQFVNVATGSVSVLLAMTGHERLLRRSYTLAAIVNVGLCWLLIPAYGALGAALAAAVSVSATNLYAVYLAWRSLGVMTIPFIRFAPRSAG